MLTTTQLRALITERKSAKNLREKQQRLLITDEEIFHEKIRVGLCGRYDTKQFDNFTRCGHEQIYRTCKNCGDVEEYSYTCNIKWCPKCNWKITHRRAQLLQLWQKTIHHPKHVVTTQRNFSVLTRKKIQEHQRNLSKLRRSEVFKNVRGGCVSVEITNEGRGWHLHAHWLLDASYISMKQLAVVWGKLVQQEYGIVHYDELNQSDFCKEVCKYVVKGSEMSDWHPDQMNEFVTAIRNRRFFFTFGSLWKQQREIRRTVNESTPPPAVCTCGSSDFVFRDELTEILREIQHNER